MKKNFTLFKSLLVAVGLLGGMNAWADDYAMVWQNTFDDADTYQAGWSGAKSRSAASATVAQGTRSGDEKYISFSNSAYNTVWTYTLSSISAISEATDYVFQMDFALTRCNTDGNTILQITNASNNEIFKIQAVGGDTGKGSTTLVTGSVYTNGSTTAETETVTMNTFRGGTLTWYNITISSNATDGTDLKLTKCDDATETKTYHLSDNFVALGKIILDPANVNNTKYGGGCFDNFVFSTPKVAGFVANPTPDITGAYNNSRKFTLSCITEGTTIYYAESDLEKDAEGWTIYTGVVTSSAETIYAYAKDGDGNTSEKISFETGAGSTINLAGATLTHSAANQYTIGSNQSAILGTPTATVHYQIDGGAEQTSTAASVNVAIATDGILTYWLTANGYGATEPVNANVYAYTTYAVASTVDLCTCNDNDWAQKGDEVSVSGDNDNTFYQYKDQEGNVISDGLFAATFSNDGSTWRIQRYYGGTKNQNTAESIALLGLKKDQVVQVNSTMSATSTTNLTVIEGNTFTGTQSYLVVADGDVTLRYAKDAVITKVYVCQDNVSKTISAAGWATYCSPYALDFTNEIDNLEAAYIVTGANSDQLTDDELILKEVEGTVPANTGLLLKGVGECVIPVVASGNATNVSDNVLVGVTAEEEKEAKSIWVLMNGDNGVGFYYNNKPFTVSANTAYIPATATNFAIPTTGTKARFFSFGGDNATAIKSVESEKAENGVMYNLAGQRVGKGYKGIVIVNGKKFNN